MSSVSFVAFLASPTTTPSTGPTRKIARGTLDTAIFSTPHWNYVNLLIVLERLKVITTRASNAAYKRIRE